MKSPDKDLQRQFSTLLAQNARLWRKALNEELKPQGLTEATWLPLLHLLRAGGPLLQKDLATSLTLDSSSVVRLVDELESSGHVMRAQVEDRRARAVTLTPLGKRTVAKVELVADQARENFLSGVSHDELKVAVKVLLKVSQALAPAELKVAA